MPDGAVSETRVAPRGGVVGDRSNPSIPTWVWLVAFVVIGLGLRLYDIGQQPMWLDEAATFKFSSEPLVRILSVVRPVDIGNPPLYYALIHLWTGIAGESDVALRLPSVLFGVLLVPASYLVGREVGGRTLGLLVAALAAISPSFVEFSQHARGYTLLALAATVAMWGLARLLADGPAAGRPMGSSLRRRGGARSEGARGADLAWVAVMAGTSAALLTHNTAIFLVAGLNLVVFVVLLLEPERRGRFLWNWVIAQAIAGLIWAPWVVSFLWQSWYVYKVDFWLEFPDLPTIGGSAVQTVCGAWPDSTPGSPTSCPAAIGLIGLAVVGLLFVLAVRSWRGPDRRWVVFVVTLTVVAPAGELLASLWDPIFLPRTWIWVVVPVSLAVARGITVLPRRWGSVAMALVAVVGLSSYAHYQSRYVVAGWDVATAAIVEGYEPGDVVVSERYAEWVIDRYLASSSTGGRIDAVGLRSAGDVAGATAGADRVWVARATPPCPWHEQLDMAALLPDGLDETRRFEAPCVDITLFERR